MPAGSKTDPLLAKAEPISDGGSASVITYLRKGKSYCAAAIAAGERRENMWERICERNNSADTKVSEEGGGGGAPETGAEIPLQPVGKTMVRQAVPLHPMEVNGGADIHLQPVEDPMLEEGDVPQRRLWPRGKPTLEQAAGKTCGPMERGAHAGAVCSWRTAPCGRDPRWSSLWRTAARGKDSRWRSSWRSLPWEGPHTGAGEECEESGSRGCFFNFFLYFLNPVLLKCSFYVYFCPVPVSIF